MKRQLILNANWMQILHSPSLSCTSVEENSLFCLGRTDHTVGTWHGVSLWGSHEKFTLQEKFLLPWVFMSGSPIMNIPCNLPLPFIIMKKILLLL